MERLRALILLSVIATPVFAQPDPSDPDLRLWLRAEDLATAGLSDGDYISPLGSGVQWVDQSMYGTVMAPRNEFNPFGPFGGFGVDEAPLFTTADINGNSFPVVRFERAAQPTRTPEFGSDPDCTTPTACQGIEGQPGTGSIDRLFQTNNLESQGSFDPLNFGNGTSLTAIAVYFPEVTSPATNGFQPIMSKRGTNSAAWHMGIREFTGHFTSVQYAGIQEHRSANVPLAQTWHITAMKLIDDPMDLMNVNDVVEWWDDETEDGSLRMSQLNVVPDNITVNRNGPLAADEPFGIGAHAQDCCGELETFFGNIAELIVYARDLDETDFGEVQDYLNNKYFGAPGPECDLDGDNDCDTDDIDLLTAEIAAGTNDPAFDLTDDDLVNLDDRDAWLSLAGEENIGPGRAYLLGDANLDETVDGADFLAWNSNKFLPADAWSLGDFNADGTIDGADFLIWNNFKFQSSDAPVSVPEPHALLLGFALILLLPVKRARKN